MKRTNFPAIYFILTLFLLSVSGVPLRLWPNKRELAASNHIRKLAASEEGSGNQRLKSLEHAHFFTVLSEVFHQIRENVEVEFSIPLFNGTLEIRTCFLTRGNPIVPRALAAKFPEIELFQCTTRNKGELRMVLDKSRIGGFTASFFDGLTNKNFYVDNLVKNTDSYIIYDTAVAIREGKAPEIEFSIDFEDIFSHELFTPSSTSRLSEFPAYKFKLAPLANDRYSMFHGNTYSSVMAALIECFSRVNGIYSRELGVFFEFIEDAELGICLEDDRKFACYDLDNDASVIRDADYILEELGVPYESYDIGHVLTTGSGGLAYLGALCSGFDKAGGTTGLPEPYTDVFFVDYVSHEIGHQLSAGHVFRDCAGPNDGNLMSSSAVEPGSGSSILGYAGICGGNNIQGFSDPYFNGISLEQMREFVEARGQSCGEKFLISNTVPEVEVPTQCEVPVGSYFQLKGRSVDQTGDTSFFTWERADNGYEDLDSITLGAFRSWKPTTSTSRFFPNLYTIMYPEYDLTLSERLPTAPRDMIFRFTERRLYETSAIANSFQTNIMGDFSYVDLRVNFVDTPSIKLTGLPSSFSNGDLVAVEWESMNNVKEIRLEVLIAENIISKVSGRDFDYEKDIKELDWEIVAISSSSETRVNFVLPNKYDGKDINIMIRSSLVDDMEGCFFFDLAHDIQVGQQEEDLKVYVLLGLIGLILGTGFAITRGQVRSKSIETEISSKFALETGQQPVNRFIGTKNPMADF